MQHVGKEAFLLAKGRSSSRHTQPHSRKPLLLLLLIFLVAAAAVGIYMLDTKEPAPQTQEAALPVNTATATIAAVGDLTISDALAADALQSEVDRVKKEGSLIEDEHKQLQETLATVQAERDKLRQQLAEKANHHWWEFWK